MYMDRERGIEVAEDRSRGKTFLEFIQGGLRLRCPIETRTLVLAEERGHGCHDAGITVNETTVEVGKADEYLNILNAGWCRPRGNGGDAVWVHRNAVRRNNEAEEGDGGGVEFAFTELARQSIVAEPLEDPFDIGDMLFEGFREYEDVIEVNNTEDVKEFAEAVVCIGLERCRGIS